MKLINRSLDRITHMARPIGSTSKEKIIVAVERLIANDGINRISLRDIANEAHLSLGTLFYHYASKNDIVFDVITKHINALKNEYIEWLSRHQNDLTPERFLEVIFFKGVKLFNRSRLHVFLINECMSDNPALKNRFIDKYREWRIELKKGVQNVFPNNKSPDAMADLLLLIIDGLVISEVHEMPQSDPGAIIQLVKKVGQS